MAVRTSCHPFMFITVNRMPLASKVAIVCATLASAVGDTKLALTAIVDGEEARRMSLGRARRRERGKGP